MYSCVAHHTIIIPSPLSNSPFWAFAYVISHYVIVDVDTIGVVLERNLDIGKDRIQFKLLRILITNQLQIYTYSIIIHHAMTQTRKRVVPLRWRTQCRYSKSHSRRLCNTICLTVSVCAPHDHIQSIPYMAESWTEEKLQP